MIRACVALLAAVVAFASHAGSDKPWAELDGSGQGDPLVGIALLVLGYGALKLLASGDLIPLLRDLAKGLLVIYAPVVLLLCIAFAASWLLQATGLSKEVAAWLALPFAALCTWISLSRLILRGQSAGGAKGAGHKNIGQTSTTSPGPPPRAKPLTASSVASRPLQRGGGPEDEVAGENRVDASAEPSGQPPSQVAPAAEQLTVWCTSCGHCIRGTVRPAVRFFDVQCPACRTLLRCTARGDVL